jgi:TetR/AcrR family transcriptional regulator
MTKVKLTRKERERMRHKDEILVAALNLFSTRGFHNVSMQEVAKASEFAVGTLYNFFDSKEALFDELTRNCGERISKELVTILDSPGTEVERLSKFIRHAPILLEENAEIVRLYVAELGTRGAKISKSRNMDDFHIILDTALQKLIANGIYKGIFRKVDPKIATLAINSTIETLAFENVEHFDKTAVTEIFDKVEQFFKDVLLLPEDKDDN